MTLLLDPDIRDWVVLPLFVIIVCAGLLRHSVSILLQGAKQKLPVHVQRTQNTLRQTTKIRSGACHYITTYKFYLRKQHYQQYLKDQAEFLVKEKEEKGAGGDDDDPMAALMNNPMGMLGGNMAFMVQNMVMMQGIQHFFSGFLLLKVPFGLTAGFKHMFQRGMADLPDLEPAYVSSVSWYFLVMYGLHSLFRIVIGDPPLEVMEQEQLVQQFGLQNQPMPGVKQDTETMVTQLKQEADNLELVLIDHKAEIDGVEKRLLKSRYPRKQLESADDLFVAKVPAKAKKRV